MTDEGRIAVFPEEDSNYCVYVTTSDITKMEPFHREGLRKANEIGFKVWIGDDLYWGLHDICHLQKLYSELAPRWKPSFQAYTLEPYSMTYVPREPLNALAAKIYGAAKAKGWHSRPDGYHLGDTIGNLYSEVSKALECYRNGDMALQYVVQGDLRAPMKPVGFPSEMADVLIRCLDIMHEMGIDIDKVVNDKMAYNTTRSQRHGGKKT